MVDVGTVVVIFTSTRAVEDPVGYADMAALMESLAAQQDGFLSVTSVRDPVSGLGITVSYWRDDAAARAWKAHGLHLEAQRLGRERWYDGYDVVVADVRRTYGFGTTHGAEAGAPHHA